MHKKILRRLLVGIAIFSCGFARTKAESLVQTGRDGYGNSLYAYQGQTTVNYSNFSETNTIYVNYKGNVKTDGEYNVLQLRAGGNGRRSVQMFWNKNGDINWINGRKLILNSGWCYSTETVVGTQCPSYDLTIQDIKQVGNTTFTDFTVQTNAGTDPGAWYSYGTQFFCLYNEQGNSYCTKSGQPEQYNNDATLVALCGDDLGCSAGTFETLYGNSPFTNGGGNGNTNEANTGSICPTIRFTIDMYGSKYNTGLCYSNTQQVSGGEVVQVQPISIFEAFNTYQAYRQAYEIIAQNCHTSTVNTVEQCQVALQGIGKKQSEILLKVIQAQLPTEKVYQYCHYQLNFTEEEKRTTGICRLTEEERYATGVNQQNSGPNPLEGISDALQEASQEEIPIPEDNTVFDEILPEGITTRKDVVMDYKFYSHFALLYTKITKLFQARGEQDGIIPPYITSIILLIILFKIYKK